MFIGGVEFYDGKKFYKYFSQLYGKLLKLDSTRQANAKFSQALKDLTTHFDIKDSEVDFDTLSTTSSISLAASSFNMANGLNTNHEKISAKSSVVGGYR